MRPAGHSARRGAGMGHVVVVMATVAALSVVLLSGVETSTQSRDREAAEARVNYVAEGALVEAWAVLRHRGEKALVATTYPLVLDGTSYGVEMNGGGDENVRLVATAEEGGTRARVELVARRVQRDGRQDYELINWRSQGIGPR